MVLTQRERAFLVRACWAPSLQPFAVLAGVVGLDEALERLDSRLLPAEVVVQFAEAGWTIDDLPSRQTVETWILGVRVYAGRGRRDAARKYSLATSARRLGISVGVARRAEDALMIVAGPIFRGKLRNT